MRLDDQNKEQETPKNRIDQAEVLTRLCTFRGPSWSFIQTTKGSVFDAFLSNEGQRVEIAEVKCRTCTFAAFEKEGYRIDKKKITSNVLTGKRYGLPSILVVRWKCGTHGFVNLSALVDDKPYPFPSQVIKRGDRNELADLQSDIPMHLFTKF